MRVVIFGATGMVGTGVLLECLDDARVEHVLLVSRHPTDISHPKIREIVHADFTEFGSLQATLTDPRCLLLLSGRHSRRLERTPVSPPDVRPRARRGDRPGIGISQPSHVLLRLWRRH